MQARVSKWGNSLGIRIPVMAAEEMSLSDGEVVELIFRDGEIIIKKKESTLEDLVTQITTDNRHDETDFGTVGRELL
ncbi:AbrB/MazE/SpoVT family DNA-binding domain-containing protein [Alicyclobacillus sp. SP_1]|uniref:AbrB/MazE/SpoVT family DNA-binding domain-containing protein n=1 Tax=Alicyclobacillus sp. SP_1 TaxID=2942475 RepID=UPI002157DA91|nr:AbrB/MazE/SpoVT family DNA-binding domain-containing protein [Alicyclobacillus sp. SP_1]